MTRIVALTGGIGSGKTEASQVFERLGVPVVDLDLIAHEISSPGNQVMLDVRNSFGDTIFDEHGQLNRFKLRELVFSNPDALDALNRIMHPAIRLEAIRQIESLAKHSYIILAIPLLLESREDWRMIDHVIVIDCSEEVQLQRVVQRSKLAEPLVRSIIASQSSREDRLNIANTVIYNNDSLDNLSKNILDFHNSMLKDIASKSFNGKKIT